MFSSAAEQFCIMGIVAPRFSLQSCYLSRQEPRLPVKAAVVAVVGEALDARVVRRYSSDDDRRSVN